MRVTAGIGKPPQIGREMFVLVVTRNQQQRQFYLLSDYRFWDENCTD
jgi:hypothetical protein